MSRLIRNIKGDIVIWLVVIFLSIFSLLAVYSSTGTLAYKYQSGNTEYYMIKHFLILVFGFLLMYLAHRVKYTNYSRIFQIALYIAVPLLILTLVIGLSVHEAKRVIVIPIINLSFQTSDFAKLTLIMYLARLLTKMQGENTNFWSAFVNFMIPVLIVCGLILPANLSTSAMLFTTSVILMFIGRMKFKYLLYFIGICIAALTIFLLIQYNLPGDKQGRLWTWKHRLEQSNTYQVEQSKIAIASGKLFGKGPGNSTQRNYLPHPYSDFIFSIIIEEYGLAGGGLIVFFYLVLFFRAVRIITKIPRNFGAFLTFGVSFSLVFQAMINMGVAVNLLPVTGQPLPFISMGGTSIWFTSISIGIILSVSKEVGKNTEISESNYVQAQV
jgi:cell division protein FtsW